MYAAATNAVGQIASGEAAEFALKSRAKNVARLVPLFVAYRPRCLDATGAFRLRGHFDFHIVISPIVGLVSCEVGTLF
jgi:hypothetical protein